MSDIEDYKDDEIGKIIYLRNSISIVRGTILHDREFIRQMGNDYPVFVLFLGWLEDDLDEYERKLHEWHAGPWVIIAAVDVESSATPVGAVVALVALVFGSSHEVDVPRDVAMARDTANAQAQRVRNHIPVDLADEFIVHGMFDARVAMERGRMEYEAGVRGTVEAVKASRIDAGPIGELVGVLGTTVPAAISNAFVVAERQRIAAIEQQSGRGPQCGDLRQEYQDRLTRANNATSRNSLNVGILQIAWPNFIRAALNYARCLLGGPGQNPPAAPA